MKLDVKLEHLLGQVFDSMREDLRKDLGHADYEQQRRDFIFHMTDWSDDLAAIDKLFEGESASSEELASKVIVGFLYHAIPHLNAAGRLLLDTIPDAFAPPSSG